MEADKRNHKRFNPESVTAQIVIETTPGEEVVFDGVVVDMSYSGIKIKLNQPMEEGVEAGELRLSIILPESGVPMSIHGMIKHIQEQHQLGLKYADKHREEELDSMMFECVKYSSDPEQT